MSPNTRYTCTRRNNYLIVITVAVAILFWNNLTRENEGIYSFLGGKANSLSRKSNFQSNIKIGILTTVEVFSYLQMTEWNQDFIVNFIEDSHFHQDFYLLPFNTPVGVMKVYTHNPLQDDISETVKEFGSYEPDIMEIIFEFVGAEKDVSFIDVGANIGLHTVAVAKVTGRNVLAIEMIRDNVQHLCMTAERNNLQRQIKVVFNALGRNHEPSQVITEKDGRFGGGYVNSSNIDTIKRQSDGDTYHKFTLDMPTVTLDDLLTWKYIHRFNKHFLKMDVEGSEASVMEGAKKFLKMTRVTGILMEWRWHRERANTAKTIISIMQELNFNPFQSVMSAKENTRTTKSDVEVVQKLFTRALDIKKFSLWPSHVLWLPDTLNKKPLTGLPQSGT